MRDAKRFRDLKKGNRVWVIKEWSEIKETKLLRSEMDWSNKSFYIYLDHQPLVPIRVDWESSINSSKTVWLDSEEAKQYFLDVIKRKWAHTVEQLNFLIDEEKRLSELIQIYES